MTGTLSAQQYQTLRRPLNANRVASRNQGGKTLSYLESWDVRAHLIRMFGFGNFDVETLSTQYLGDHDYMSTGSNPKQMREVIYRATVQLTLRDADGEQIAVYSESAVGSASIGLESSGHGDIHDNALKTAASDALKRCAINLGTQFGLSLYDNGNRNDVVKGTLVTPPGVEEETPSPDQAARLTESVGHSEQESEAS